MRPSLGEPPFNSLSSSPGTLFCTRGPALVSPPLPASLHLVQYHLYQDITGGFLEGPLRTPAVLSLFGRSFLSQGTGRDTGTCEQCLMLLVCWGREGLEARQMLTSFLSRR